MDSVWKDFSTSPYLGRTKKSIPIESIQNEHDKNDNFNSPQSSKRKKKTKEIYVKLSKEEMEKLHKLCMNLSSVHPSEVNTTLKEFHGKNRKDEMIRKTDYNLFLLYVQNHLGFETYYQGNELQKEYQDVKEFAGIDHIEWENLRHETNYMKNIINVTGTEGYGGRKLITIHAASLFRQNEVFVSGGGQTKQMKRRKKIYEEKFETKHNEANLQNETIIKPNPTAQNVHSNDNDEIFVIDVEVQNAHFDDNNHEDFDTLADRVHRPVDYDDVMFSPYD